MSRAITQGISSTTRSESSNSLSSVPSALSSSLFSSLSSRGTTAATSDVEAGDLVFSFIDYLFMVPDAGISAEQRRVYKSTIVPLLIHELKHCAYGQKYHIQLCSAGFSKSSFSSTILISVRKCKAKRPILGHMQKLPHLKDALNQHGLTLHVVYDKITPAAGYTDVDETTTSAYLELPPGSDCLCRSKTTITKTGSATPSTCTNGLTWLVGLGLYIKTAQHPWEVEDTLLEGISDSDNDDDNDSDEGVPMSIYPSDTANGDASNDEDSTSDDDLLELGCDSKSFNRMKFASVTAPKNRTTSTPAPFLTKRLSGHVRPTYEGKEADWVLCNALEAAPELTVGAIMRNQVGGHLISKFHHEDPAVKMPVLISTHEGEVNGMIEPGEVYYVSGSQVYQMRLVTLDKSLQPGCSGAAVTHKDEYCGAIQVVRENVPWAYMIPAHLELEEMEAVCGMPVSLPQATSVHVDGQEIKQSSETPNALTHIMVLTDHRGDHNTPLVQHCLNGLPKDAQPNMLKGDNLDYLGTLDTTEAITTAMLAKHYLPEVLLSHGPLAIRHIIGYLMTLVPGFSRITSAKARRLVKAALEGRGGGKERGDTKGDAIFRNVGWGRWEAIRVEDDDLLVAKHGDSHRASCPEYLNSQSPLMAVTQARESASTRELSLIAQRAADGVAVIPATKYQEAENVAIQPGLPLLPACSYPGYRDRQGPQQHPRRRPSETTAYHYDEDDEETGIYFFVPGEDIDTTVLAFYLRHFVDTTATIEPARRPQHAYSNGYMVTPSHVLSKEALEDLIADTRNWRKEQRSEKYRRSSYDYCESDTSNHRQKVGPTLEHTASRSRKARHRTQRSRYTASSCHAQPLSEDGDDPDGTAKQSIDYTLHDIKQSRWVGEPPYDATEKMYFTTEDRPLLHLSTFDTEFSWIHHSRDRQMHFEDFLRIVDSTPGNLPHQYDAVRKCLTELQRMRRSLGMGQYHTSKLCSEATGKRLIPHSNIITLFPSIRNLQKRDLIFIVDNVESMDKGWETIKLQTQERNDLPCKHPEMVTEGVKGPLELVVSLCSGYTISRSILADALPLSRSDQLYTTNHTSVNSTVNNLHSRICPTLKGSHKDIKSLNILVSPKQYELTDLSSPEAQFFFADCEGLDRSPLHAAATGGASATIRLLLNKGARPPDDCRDIFGMTAMSIAAYTGMLDLLKQLLQAKGDSLADRKDTQILRVLSVAISMGHAEVVTNLLSHGRRHGEFDFAQDTRSTHVAFGGIGKSRIATDYAPKGNSENILRTLRRVRDPVPDCAYVDCPCGHGYLNDEGSFVPGRLVRSNQALWDDDWRKMEKKLKRLDEDDDDYLMKPWWQHSFRESSSSMTLFVQLLSACSKMKGFDASRLKDGSSRNDQIFLWLEDVGGAEESSEDRQ